jgi:hypothetical protein
LGSNCSLRIGSGFRIKSDSGSGSGSGSGSFVKSINLRILGVGSKNSTSGYSGFGFRIYFLLGAIYILD